MAALAPAARADTPATPVRVGLVDVTDSAAGHAAVAALRARLGSRPGIALPKDGARAALEEPLEATPDGASAGSPAALRAAQLVRAAREAYSRFDYDGALERLRQAELALATAPPDAARLLVDANLLAGVVWADRGDAPRALDSFRLVHRLAPAMGALDPGSYRPRVVALYAQAVATPETRLARLDVVTDPAGADVWIDGQRAGVAPLSRALPAGFHYVAVTAEGSVPRLEKPLLRAGEDTRLALLLSRSPPEERARVARAELAAGRLGWDRGPAAIAASASLDMLVVVRDAAAPADAHVEAAIYDASIDTLGVWIPASPPEPVLVALGASLAGRASATKAPMAEGARERSSSAPPPWYRTWWIAPPLLAVGAAVGLGTLWIIDRERTTTYAFNRWCFNNTCAP